VTTAEALRRAAQEIRERGWLSGMNDENAGSVCAMAALGLASGDDAGVFVAARKLILDVTGSACVANWNDAPERTADEVIAALLKAAELAESRA
jgi:hypothetical protein